MQLCAEIVRIEMKTVFISSVIKGFEDYRQAVREAIEVMDCRPVMSELFGSRSYSSEVACVTEVEQSDIYILIMGPEYGFLTDEGISVTRAEYRAARKANRPILVFVQGVEMETDQTKFREEVEAYHDGFFRTMFSTVHELKDQVIRALRQLETVSQAISEDEFESKVSAAFSEIEDEWNDDPRVVITFLPQPERMVDIVALEEELDSVFQSLCDSGLAGLRDGYKPQIESDWTGLKADDLSVAYYPDGLIVLVSDPTLDSDGILAGHFAPPDKIIGIANGFKNLVGDNSGFLRIELRNMSNTYVADPPDGSSLTMRMWGANKLGFSRLFVPMTKGSYDDWISHCINRFRRKFRYKSD